MRDQNDSIIAGAQLLPVSGNVGWFDLDVSVASVAAYTALVSVHWW